MALLDKEALLTSSQGPSAREKEEEMGLEKLPLSREIKGFFAPTKLAFKKFPK